MSEPSMNASDLDSLVIYYGKIAIHSRLILCKIIRQVNPMNSYSGESGGWGERQRHDTVDVMNESNHPSPLRRVQGFTKGFMHHSRLAVFVGVPFELGVHQGFTGFTAMTPSGRALGVYQNHV